MKKAIGIIILELLWCNVAQALPVCEGSDISKWTNCKGTYSISDGTKYAGEFKDDELYGLETLTLEDIYSSTYGTKYVGEFKNGLHHGQGIIIYAFGFYVGQFKYDKRHGQGTWTSAGGDKYVGEYKDGERHGQGTYTYANGDKYVGNFKYNEQHEQGTFTLADGTVKKGIWEWGKLIEPN